MILVVIIPILTITTFQQWNGINAIIFLRTTCVHRTLTVKLAVHCSMTAI
jgi:hypothetical protein